MRYYTIQNDNILIANNEYALSRFYSNVQILPEDYEEGKYIIGDIEIEIEGEVITIRGLVPNPNWEEEQQERREQEFNKSFFNTSLGYVRRLVTMADGSHKDFLSDLLPAIFASTSAGVAVNILTYDKPPFTEDVEDWEQYQHKVIVTPQFINECFMQLSNDFLPINEE